MLGATTLWGAMTPIAKNVLEEGLIDGLSLSVLRIGGGAILFILASLLPRSITGDVAVIRRDLWKLLLASMIMISANQGLFIIGIEYTAPVDTSVMCTLTPVFTLVLAAIFIGQPLNVLKVSGVVIGLGGALLMAFTDEGSVIAKNPLLGDMLCLLAQLCAAVYYVFFLDVINKYPPFTIMKWMFIFAGITYVPCMIPFIDVIPLDSVSVSSLMSLVYIIVFPTFIAYLIIPFAQRLLRPTVISIYAYFQPVVAALIAWIMGLVIFGPLRIIATILIFTGVFLVSTHSTSKNSHIRNIRR